MKLTKLINENEEKRPLSNEVKKQNSVKNLIRLLKKQTH